MFTETFEDMLNQMQIQQLNENTNLQNQENQYFNILLQFFDQIQMNKDVQYRVISILKKLVHYYPNFMAIEKRDALTRLSINMILAKLNNVIATVLLFQELPLNETQQQLVSDHEVALLRIIIDFLVSNGVGISATPYQMMEQFKDQYGITQFHVNRIKLLLDYAMTMNETFANNAIDVLSACIMIHESQIETGEFWVSQILFMQSGNSIILRQVIETSMAEDLLELQV